MQTLVTVIHLVASFFLVTAVLLQSGKGADVSATFGGSSQTVLGTSGGANFFTRFTAIMAAVFFATSLGLSVIQASGRKSLFDDTPAATAPAKAASPAAPSADASGSPVAPEAAAPAAPATK